MNVVLSGMMGSGKTTVAGEFARYGYAVVDTDEIIVGRYGEINAIFSKYGEARFREIEAEVIGEVALTYQNAVISLGGGSVLRAENVENLKRTGKIFYLRAKKETIISRLKGDTTRPLLQGGLEERVTSILSARAKIYESSADEIIDTDGLTPQEIVKIIEERAL